ncbi:MAG TPA: MBL fold metallo-hydrolase [Anaerolineae bacterium]|nr:MBL fold metallo-hydrolase [Anaerolineae bacterium]
MIKISHYGAVTRFDLARTIAGRGRYWTAAYLIDDLLIDSGCAYTASEFTRQLEDRSIARIVNTHSHEDHIGANASLQRQRSGIQILAHELALPVLADPREKQPIRLYQRVFWGWPEPSAANPVMEGDVIETEHHNFQVLHTPGHSPDHICLYESTQGWIFSGDMFVGGQERALRADYDIWGILASLKRLAGLRASMLFPACARVRSNPKGELLAKIAYLEEKIGRVIELHRRGCSVGAITRQVFGGPMPVELITMGNFTRRHMVSSILRRNSESSD